MTCKNDEKCRRLHVNETGSISECPPMAKRSLMYEFAYSVDRSANQMIPGTHGAISQPNRNLAADYQSDIQWIGLRENLNRKPWFLPSNIGLSGSNVPIIQFYEICLCDGYPLVI
jgi:hypothetical protein